MNMNSMKVGLRTPVHRRCSSISVQASQATAPPQEFRTCLITGANTGIGLETALATAKSGYYTVLACRDQAKAEAAKAKIKYGG